MAILVTGGAGYIGSHTCVELLNRGYEVVVLDNLYNSSEKALDRVKEITGKFVKFYQGDILNREDLEEVFEKENIENVIHFAGLKAVGESVAKPWEYYHNNITGTLLLCDVMRQHDCFNLIFSSSATVYGDPAEIPITEKCPKGQITNPYGQTKGMLEQILTDLHVGDERWNVMLLRYFNPIGAHPSGPVSYTHLVRRGERSDCERNGRGGGKSCRSQHGTFYHWNCRTGRRHQRKTGRPGLCGMQFKPEDRNDRMSIFRGSTGKSKTGGRKGSLTCD